MPRKKLMIFSGRAHPALAWEICEYLSVPQGRMEVFEFSNENIFVRILENVRGSDAFIIQPFAPPVNTRIMELLIILDAFWRASADRVTAVIPYYAYGRTDKKDQPRVPITAKLIASLLEAAHVNRVLTMDLHAEQIQGFFDVPVDHLIAAPIFSRHLSANREWIENAVMVAPDAGSAKRVRALARNLHLPLAVVDKRRKGNDDQTEITFVIGEVAGKTAILVDDEIDTGGSVVNAAEALLREGARDVMAMATHAVFSGDAPKRLQQSPLSRVIVTNTLPIPTSKNFPKLTVLSVAPLIAEAIRSIHEESSITRLFEGF
jgi:ribose-phosphate pyrophosphokinase